MLSAAFSRSLRDPFVHARNAALLALAATADLFSEDDCATKLLPIMCPSLVDKEKLIRDQAQKSVDIYISRIRKYAATMPDTALPPSAGLSTGTPRMGTPANDGGGGGWTGWAISSFTNKLAATSGQMQSGSTTNGTSEQRSSSVPPPSTSSKPPVPLASKPGMTLQPTRSAVTIPSAISPDPAAAFNDETEDFDDDWGAFVDDDDNKNDNAAAEDDDPWGTPAVSKPSTTTSYDDKGEPDFAGWLAAQSNAKKSVKSPLPKGLTKSSTSSTSAAKSTRPVMGARANTTGSTGTKRVVSAPTTKKQEVKKVEKPKENEEEEEGWGDAW